MELARKKPTFAEEIQIAKDQAIERLLPPILHVDALPTIGTDVIIEGLWRRQEVLLLGGHAKSWKSWAQMDLSYCIANGFSWLVWNQVKKGRVLHIDLELFDFEIRKRFESIRDSYEAGTLENIEVLSLRGINFSLADFSALSDRIETGRYSAISFDPTYRMVAGSGMSESDSGVVIDLMNRALTLAKKTGAGVSLLQHFSKGNQTDKRALECFSGSGVWGRAPDSCVTFRELEDEKCYNVTVDERHWKGHEPFAVRFNHPRFEVDGQVDPDNLKRPKKGRPPTFSVEDLCSLVGCDEYITWADLLRRAEAAKVSKRTFERRLKEAKLNGFLALRPTDTTYFLTASYVEKHWPKT